MARGSSYGDNSSLPSIPVTPPTYIPRRATRELPAVHNEEFETEEIPVRRTGGLPSTQYYVEEHPLSRHRIWLNPMLICMVVIVIGSLVIISAALYQRPGPSATCQRSKCAIYPNPGRWIRSCILYMAEQQWTNSE